MTDKPAASKIHRGLMGVTFDRTTTSDIDGKAGELWYRGYSIHDLAANASFEETACLLMKGALPTQDELDGFSGSLRSARELPTEIYDIIRLLKDAHPMEVLRTAVSSLGGFDTELEDNGREAILRKGIKLTSQIPTIITAHHAIREGRTPVAPSQNLPHAANFLYMLSGEEPGEDAAALMDTDFILHAEHGSNASTFTARVVTGTNANFHAAITAAIAALSGPAHGGAAEDVMHMAEEIGDPANAAAWIKGKRKARIPITGFGHRVYKAEDPRARHMRDGVEELSREVGEPKWFDILQAVVVAMAPYARHGVNVNVDFYSGAAYYLHGIPMDLFVPIFTMGRVPGWTTQILEQLDNNILLRPLLEYNGPDPRPWVPLENR